MKEIMRICLSEDGKRVLMYSENGESLERVHPVREFETIAATVMEAVGSAFQDDFAARNGRHFNTCMGYNDCQAGMCDEHFPNEGAY